MENMYNRIKKLRLQRGWSQEELAKKIGYADKTSIAKIEAGKVDLPQSKIIAFSNVFFVTPSYLMDGNNSLPNSTKRKGIPINVLGRVAAGIPIESVEEIIDTEEITEELAATGDFFGLQIKGDSMEPRITEGDVVIVRQQEDAENGETVIVLINGEDATCKRLKKYSDGIMLLSNNPKYEPMVFSKQEIIDKPVKIIGKVVELRGKF
ncbi:MAG: helix-turn-helix domain-containing protein [Lachnospiraceae bacterium]|nr:helix-turn-helix domain-containing protein [Lachnospiraceae bacterium]